MNASGFSTSLAIDWFKLSLTWWLRSTILLIIGLTSANRLKHLGPAIQSAIYRVTLLGTNTLICHSP